jgi:hypothetical protein
MNFNRNQCFVVKVIEFITVACLVGLPAAAHRAASSSASSSVASSTVPSAVAPIASHLAAVEPLRDFPPGVVPLMGTYAAAPRHIVRPIGPYFLWIRDDRSGRYFLTEHPDNQNIPATPDYIAFRRFVESKDEGFLKSVDDLTVEFLEGPDGLKPFTKATIWKMRFTNQRGHRRVINIRTDWAWKRARWFDLPDPTTSLEEHDAVISDTVRPVSIEHSEPVSKTMPEVKNAREIFALQPRIHDREERFLVEFYDGKFQYASGATIGAPAKDVPVYELAALSPSPVWWAGRPQAQGAA